MLCDSKREPVPVNIAEPEEEAETYSYFKTALSWDPSEEIIRKGQKIKSTFSKTFVIYPYKYKIYELNLSAFAIEETHCPLKLFCSR